VHITLVMLSMGESASLCLNLRRWLFNFWQTTAWIQDLLHISGFLDNICTQKSLFFS